jgi:hypothetical protein
VGLTARVQPTPELVGAARALLWGRYPSRQSLDDLRLAQMVAERLIAGEVMANDELMAAITLLHGAHARLDEFELALIDAVREAGRTWTQIGRALGFGPGGDLKQGAASRRRRLMLAAAERRERDARVAGTGG